jgi:cation transport ATPase
MPVNRDRRWPSTTVVLVSIAVTGLAGGAVAALSGRAELADVVWAATTVAITIPAAWWVAEALWRRRFGSDVIAVLALAGTLAVGEFLAGAVIALMFSGGRALEERAAHRARRDLGTLLSRAPKFAHRRTAHGVETVDADAVRAGDRLIVRPGEVVPVDGLVDEGTAVIDESMITGEPVPVEFGPGGELRSGTVNAGSPVPMLATASTGESTYAGLVRLAREAAASSAPFVRMADRYAAFFLPATLLLAGAAWLFSGDSVRAVAVLVVATPCPLILAAPIAFVSGMSRCARRGVVVKGGAALDALGRARVLLFDKTGTLTVGRPALVDVASADGTNDTEVLRLAASLDQASPHVLAAAIVDAARALLAARADPNAIDEGHFAQHLYTADQPDGDTLLVSVTEAQKHLDQAGAEVVIEEVVADKRVVPKERVRLDKDVHTEERQVSDEVRKEQIETDGIDHGIRNRNEN